MKFKLLTLFCSSMATLSIAVAAPATKDLSSLFSKEVVGDSAMVTKIVAAQIAKDKDRACDIVKAAIIATEADDEMIAKIVTAAISASPEDARLISQCAVAVAPDSRDAIYAVYSKYDLKVAGVDASKDHSKGPKKEVADASENEPFDLNPLEFPSGGNVFNPVGPTPGGPGGFPLLPYGPDPRTGLPPISPF